MTEQDHDALDDLDRKIVRALQEDGRMSIPRLAEHVQTSRATAYARFNRLVESGVIRGFTADVNPEALGYRITALVLMKSHQADWPDVAAALGNTYGVEWIGVGAGTFDFAVLVRARDLHELRDVVLDGLVRVPGVRNLETNVLLEEHRGVVQDPRRYPTD